MVQTDTVFSSSANLSSTTTPAPSKRAQGKAKAPIPSTSSSTSSSAASVPLTADERSLLKLIAALSAPALSHTQFNAVLADVKTALYNKDYGLAFGSTAAEDESRTAEEEARAELWRQAYVARWVPGRALVYRKVLEEIEGVGTSASAEQEAREGVLVLGGGSGSELLALASVMASGSSASSSRGHITVHVVDNAPWGTILQNQHDAAISHFSSLTAEAFHLSFTQADLLTLPSLSSVSLSRTRLILLCFTISELFLQSRVATLHLLQYLSASAQPATKLVVVESASLGEIEIGKAGRKYQLGMFLDHLLGDKWTKDVSEDSRWFRPGEPAKDAYPLKVENTRVVLRVYTKK